MKQCSTCKEEFADKFGFCPVDGTPLGVPAASVAEPETAAPASDESLMTASSPAGSASSEDFPHGEEETVASHAAAGAGRGEYHLTFIQDVGLTRRLAREVKAVAHDAELTWPEFKSDPAGFTGRLVMAYGNAGWKFVSQRNIAVAIIAAFVVIGSVVTLVIALERLRGNQLASKNPYENLELLGYVDESEIPKEQPTPDKGAAGTNEGKGGGAKPKQDKPGGGGGGGRHEQTPASYGKLPPAQLDQEPINPASPKPPNPNAHLPTPSTIRADEVLFKPDPRPIPYGLPNSTATTPSSGPGSNGGMGDGDRGGMGPGSGTGYGPGNGYNTGGGDAHEGGGGPGGGGGGAPENYNRTFKPGEVTRKAVITAKPEPGFTEEARKNNVTGTVRLRAVLSASGSVQGISVVKGLPDGLTEKAIAAAKQIRFTPAQKDGRTVSQYVTLEYNFNIY